ncbi:MAG: hydrogen gas-evolving membrane-bound hydrogenase subunit E [Chloroflexota bacterium]
MAVLVPTVRERLPRIPTAWIVSMLTGILFLYLASLLPAVTEMGVIQMSVPWVPDLGLTLSLYLDGLSLLFALIIIGIGAVVALYAGYYFDEARELTRFYMLLFGFMGAMLALVLAGNILTLFIAWELTSIISFLLISFYGATSAEARSGALQALIVTGGGGLALLLGLALLGTAAGSTELSQILTHTTLHEHPWYAAFTVLILVGCFSKSAQFPLHFWLPGAMSAPTPASAYLHSATMVKAGIYLLLRLYPVLGDTPLWQTGLMGFGLATMLVGAVLALRQSDLKAALAYSTVSQLGALVALIGLPNGAGLQAALIGIVAHSLYKATLFLTAGAVNHATGTRDMSKLGGLVKRMPGWALVCLLACLSMAGLPPLLGYVAKENLLEAMLETPLALIVIVVSAALTVTMALILFWDVFMGKSRNAHSPHELSRGMLFGPGVLAGGALLAGVRLDWLVRPLLQPALEHEMHLTLFSGFTTPLFLSLLAIAAGTGVFAARERWRQWTFPGLLSGTKIYNAAVGGVERAGDQVLRSQHGKLRYYLLVILGAVVLLQASAGFSHITSVEFIWDAETDLLRGMLLLLALGTMIASVVLKRHLMAALALGIAGYSVGGLFLLEPAPDVALVQFMVETLGTVLIIAMLARISAPERQQAMDNLWKQSRKGLLRDVMISVLIGGGVGLFALAAVAHRSAAQTVTSWHLANALPLLGFPDVVGAIVTDFRGMDTIIEITVFSVAALGVLTLLAKPNSGTQWAERFVRPLRRDTPQHPVLDKPLTIVKAPEDDEGEAEKLHESNFSTPLTRIMAQLVLPIALLIALSQLLYGGEGPGDGFTAGTISGLGIALWYIVFGYKESQARLGWLKPRYLIGFGLTLVIANAVLPMLGQMPFLAHVNFEQIHLPANLHLSTTLFYETGIFLTVLGCTSTVMEAITYPKEIEAL